MMRPKIREGCRTCRGIHHGLNSGSPALPRRPAPPALRPAKDRPTAKRRATFPSGARRFTRLTSCRLLLLGLKAIGQRVHPKYGPTDQIKGLCTNRSPPSRIDPAGNGDNGPGGEHPPDRLPEKGSTDGEMAVPVVRIHLRSQRGRSPSGDRTGDRLRGPTRRLDLP